MAISHFWKFNKTPSTTVLICYFCFMDTFGYILDISVIIPEK